MSNSNAELDLAGFYSADAESLWAKYKQVEVLLGPSHHSPSDGNHCESLLKEFLRRVLPDKVSVDSGFIRRVSDEDLSGSNKGVLPSGSSVASRQIDIIVHDSNNFAPLFRSEDFVVVLPQAVKAVIEVKKTLNRSDLKEALDLIAETSSLLRQWRVESVSVFTGVFAFRLGDLRTSRKEYSDSFQTTYRETIEKYSGKSVTPYLLVALENGIVFQASSQPKSFDYLSTDPGVACQFLAFLLTSFTSQHHHTLAYPQQLMSVRKQAFCIK